MKQQEKHKESELEDLGLKELSDRYIDTRRLLDETEKEIEESTEKLQEKRYSLKSQMEEIREKIKSYHQGVEEDIETANGELLFRFSDSLKINDKERLVKQLIENGHITEGVRIRKNFVRDLLEKGEIDEDMAFLDEGEKVVVREKVPLKDEEKELYEELREKRNEIAEEEGLKGYYVFSNRALKWMAKKTPTDEVEMMNIKGVGDNNFQKYGQTFLKSIRDSIGVEDLTLNEDEEKLFEDLKNFRSKRAEEEDVPHYVVFHDSTLKRLCKERPDTKEEMLQIHGIGDKRYEKYGADVIQALEGFGK
ncbi:MAG: HRDC domain-containing protein [Candidatus Thermoplasmatota archaeon]|nr:HRDC domain-containing protein [Candidatus Thermoplasmatota archaeon]